MKFGEALEMTRAEKFVNRVGRPEWVTRPTLSLGPDDFNATDWELVSQAPVGHDRSRKYKKHRALVGRKKRPAKV